MSNEATKIEKLIEAAKIASHKAYAPYSQFKVGAALWSERGIFCGSNVENASYGLSMCAERVAIFNAIGSSATRLEWIVVYTPTKAPTLPCGACRQVLVEFALDAQVMCVCDAEKRVRSSVRDLLPFAFDSEHLFRSQAEGQD